MPKVKVREDKYSLYLKAGGRIFRPVASRWSYPIWPRGFDRHIGPGFPPTPTKFEKDDSIKVTVRSQAPFAVVKTLAGSGIEYWFDHDTYIGGKKSEDCWYPSKRYIMIVDKQDGG